MTVSRAEMAVARMRPWKSQRLRVVELAGAVGLGDDGIEAEEDAAEAEGERC